MALQVYKPHQPNDIFKIKVKYEEYARCLEIPNKDLNYDNLSRLLLAGITYTYIINKEQQIFYEDKDGDMIRIVDDTDLIIAIRGINKLTLFVKYVPYKRLYQ